MNAIVPFNFDDQSIRIEDRDGQPWFVLADVCRVLDIANVGNAAARLRASERDDIRLPDATGREQATAAINEAGLYRLIMRSRKPSAERFSDWVVSEVLPTIRRTGGFGRPAIPQLDDATLRALLLGKIDQLDGLRAENVELSAKATALDQLADSSGLLCLSDAAKTIGIGPKRFIAWLIARGWIFGRSNGGHTASQARLNDGTLALKTIRYPRSSGIMQVDKQVMVTAKGLAKLAEAMIAKG